MTTVIRSLHRTRRAGSGRNLRPAVIAAVESLESRLLLTSVVVNTTSLVSSAGTTTLLDAVQMADLSTTPTTITFDPTVFATPQTITLAVQLAFSNTSAATTITGPAAGLTISGNAMSRIFQINTAVTVNMSGLTLLDGNGNDGDSGGAVANFGGNLTLNDSTITGNTSGDHGGGLYASGNATTVLNDDTISNNSCTSEDGGIANYGGTMTITDSTISGNRSNAYGGGIENDATMTLVNDTIANNVTNTDDGGGIENFGASAVISVTNCTVSGNTCNTTAMLGGGGVANDGKSFTLANSIIAGNIVTGGVGPDVLETFISLGNNLIGDTTDGTGFVTSDLTGNAASPLKADLANLGDYGGPTFTMPPLIGPAVDGGSNALIPVNITTDQRGAPRITDGIVDIGAVEVQSPTHLATTATPTGVDVGNAASPALAIASEDAGGNVVLADDSNISLAVASGPAGGMLGGTTTAKAQDGVATFSNLTFSVAGAYTLTATSTDTLASATSVSINVTPRPATQVVFATTPISAQVGVALSPAVAVDVEDATNAPAQSDNSNVTLAISSGPAGAVLTGITTIAAQSGIATFNDVFFSNAGTYTLSASDGALPIGTSASITVMPPSQLVPAIASASLPAAVVAGSLVKSKLAVVVTNSGSAFKGNVTFKFYADASTGLDSKGTLIATLPKHISLKAGQSHPFVFNVKSAVLPIGTYHVVAEIVDPSSLINVAATTQTIQVAAPFIKPSVSIGAVKPASVVVGKTASVSVTITNAGNVVANGIAITLGLSSDGTTPIAGLTLDSVNSSAAVQPGKSKTFKLHFKLTSANHGNYYPYVSATLGGVSTAMAGSFPFLVE